MKIFSEEKQGFTFPGLFFLRVPKCCSAGNIYNFDCYEGHSGGPLKKINDKVIVRHKAPLNNTLDRLALLSGIGPAFTREAACIMGLLMLAHRITQCENPYTAAPLLKQRWPQQDEPGHYCWPSRVWSMYDRTDLQTHESLVNTTIWGYWLEENAKDAGIEVVTVDGESVHAVGSVYSAFGSDKPRGHGTIRVWNIIVRDMKKLEEWYNNTAQQFIDAVIFTQDDNAQEDRLW